MSESKKYRVIKTKNGLLLPSWWNKRIAEFTTREEAEEYASKQKNECYIVEKGEKLVTEELTMSFNPDYVVPPGETLKETIDRLGITKESLAESLGLSVDEVNGLLRGVVSISDEIAESLEKATKVPAKFWIARQDSYEKQLKK